MANLISECRVQGRRSDLQHTHARDSGSGLRFRSPFGPIRPHLAPFGPIWPHLAPFGEVFQAREVYSTIAKFDGTDCAIPAQISAGIQHPPFAYLSARSDEQTRRSDGQTDAGGVFALFCSSAL